MHTYALQARKIIRAFFILKSIKAVKMPDCLQSEKRVFALKFLKMRFRPVYSNRLIGKLKNLTSVSVGDGYMDRKNEAGVKYILP